MIAASVTLMLRAFTERERRREFLANFFEAGVTKSP
jgi:hypothetical protein